MWGWGLVRGPIRDEEWLYLAQEAGLQMSFSVGEAPQGGDGGTRSTGQPLSVRLHAWEESGARTSSFAAVLGYMDG